MKRNQNHQKNRFRGNAYSDIVESESQDYIAHLLNEYHDYYYLPKPNYPTPIPKLARTL